MGERPPGSSPQGLAARLGRRCTSHLRQIGHRVQLHGLVISGQMLFLICMICSSCCRVGVVQSSWSTVEHVFKICLSDPSQHLRTTGKGSGWSAMRAATFTGGGRASRSGSGSSQRSRHGGRLRVKSLLLYVPAQEEKLVCCERRAWYDSALPILAP